MENNDIYDTTLYTDFNDLPGETKKKLLKEWLDKHPSEKKQRNLYRWLPISFAAITAVFLLVSAIMTLIGGFSVLSIVMLVLAIATLCVCIFFNERASRAAYEQAERYAVWLRREKRVVAELKPRNEKKK